MAADAIFAVQAGCLKSLRHLWTIFPCASDAVNRHQSFVIAIRPFQSGHTRPASGLVLPQKAALPIAMLPTR
jgi:hypothetical protein